MLAHRIIQGFDVSASNVKIANSGTSNTAEAVNRCTQENVALVVKNQDDCIAINSGSNIVFEDNTCSGGHGMQWSGVTTEHET